MLKYLDIARWKRLVNSLPPFRGLGTNHASGVEVRAGGWALDDLGGWRCWYQQRFTGKNYKTSSKHMVVSINGGTSKKNIWMGFSLKKNGVALWLWKHDYGMDPKSPNWMLCHWACPVNLQFPRPQPWKNSCAGCLLMLSSLVVTESILCFVPCW